MKIQFLYFEGCPHADSSWTNLMEVYEKMSKDVHEIEKIDVDSEDKAQKLNFPGSPSIIIDGKDIYDGQEPQGYHYACRVYDWPSGKSGIISKDIIEEAIKKAAP